MPSLVDLQPVRAFLGAPTPEAWVQQALQQQDILLIDHAHCEKKAASTALSLIYRYPQHLSLLHKLSRLAREELRHYEQVLALIQKRGIRYRGISAARYAEGLRCAVRREEPAKLIDTLIVGAFIEARSCERFAALIPHLDPELSGFYQRLLASEARHFELYLTYAQNLSDVDMTQRVAEFRALEANLITSPDPSFRFHSGVPALNAVADSSI